MQVKLVFEDHYFYAMVNAHRWAKEIMNKKELWFQEFRDFVIYYFGFDYETDEMNERFNTNY